jgi:hypothetical protein
MEALSVDFIAPPRHCIANLSKFTFRFLLERVCHIMTFMNADDKSTRAPIAPTVPPGAGTKARGVVNPVTKRARWAPTPPTSLSRMKLAAIIGGGAVLALALVVGLHYALTIEVKTKVVLADEFKDRVNEMADFAFRPPLKWNIDDRTQRYTYYVQGYKEPGFSPLMIFNSVPAPGSLAAFLDEHKKRIAIEEPSTKFISEEDDVIDGCRVKRIEYDCDYKASDESPIVKLRTLQFLIKDPSFPVFYKITCHSPLETYASHVPVFEASAHSFRRTELKARIKYLPPGK